MKRKFGFLFVICILCLLPAGCGGQNREKREKKNPIPVSRWFVNVCLMEDGLLYRNPDSGYMEYFDYRTREYRPLCAQPSCLHDSQECEALYLCMRTELVGRVGDRWYYYAGGSFYCCDLDGGNESKIGEFPYEPDIDGWAFFLEDSCILAAHNLDAYDENATSMRSGIYRFRFDTGETEILRPERTGKWAVYRVEDIYEGNLIYTEWNGETFEGGSEEGPILKELDLETGEEKILIGDAWVSEVKIDEEMAVCNCGSFICKFNLKTGERQEMPIPGGGGEIFCLDRELIFIFYDYETKAEGYLIRTYRYVDGEPVLIREGERGYLIVDEYGGITEPEKNDICFVPYAIYEDMVIGQLIGGGFGYMGKEDFLAGKTNWTVLGWKNIKK